MEIINLHKRCNKTKAVAKAAPKTPKSEYHLFLREQLDEMMGEDQENYRSIVSRRWKEIKEDPAGLSEYNDRTRRKQNEVEGDDSQNEKTMVLKKASKTTEFVDAVSDDEQGPAAKQPKKVPKTPKFVDTDSDRTDDEQEPTAKQPQKASKTPELVDTDKDDEQERQSKKAPKTPEHPDDEQGPAVKCIVMYSAEDEQEPAIKKLQKTSKILMFVDTGPGAEYEQGPTIKQP